jgi:hypothetical protein
MGCPEPEALALVAMASGDLSLERRAEIANHAAGCAPCHAALDALLRSHVVELPADSMASTLELDRAKAETLAAPHEDRARRRDKLATGDRVHRYVIETALGRGGMGVVYRAHDPELGRAVAIKVLQRGTGGGERLRREAQALAKLSHPNVVTVHDVGTHDGQPFIAMALVEGDTLRQWLTTARSLPAAEARGSPASPSPGAAPSPPAEPGAEDAHWFQADDYLISKKRYTGEKLAGLRLAKMTRPPARPNGAALFLDTSGTELETDAYWVTRIARPEDLAVGRLALCQTASYDKSAAAPASKQASRLGPWILAKVTDTMELAQGKVSVGDTVCAVAGVRVPVTP